MQITTGMLEAGTLLGMLGGSRQVTPGTSHPSEMIFAARESPKGNGSFKELLGKAGQSEAAKPLNASTQEAPAPQTPQTTTQPEAGSAGEKATEKTAPQGEGPPQPTATLKEGQAEEENVPIDTQVLVSALLTPLIDLIPQDLPLDDSHLIPEISLEEATPVLSDFQPELQVQGEDDFEILPREVIPQEAFAAPLLLREDLFPTEVQPDTPQITPDQTAPSTLTANSDLLTTTLVADAPEPTLSLRQTWQRVTWEPQQELEEAEPQVNLYLPWETSNEEQPVPKAPGAGENPNPSSDAQAEITPKTELSLETKEGEQPLIFSQFPIETADFRTLMTPLTGSNPNATLLGQIDQWMDALKAGNVRLTEGQVTAMEMTLHPRNLGKLQLKLEMENGELRAWFATQSQIVKQALENQMSDLKDLLAEQGLNVAKLSVQVSNGQQEAASFKESMGSGNNSGLINLVSSLPPGDGEVQTAAKLWSGLMGGRLYLRI